MTKRGACWVGQFRAMASPCEIHLETGSRKHAMSLSTLAMNEALRIEAKFSRYLRDNIVWKINNSAGVAIRVDEETTRLLDFAHQCHELSDGLFDVTSGVLRAAWTFDGSDKVPSAHQINELLPYIGWQKIDWQTPFIKVPPSMQIDFGGIGKEYAVDRTVGLMRESTNVPFLVNFGGDLHASAPPVNSGSWQVGIEAVNQAISGTDIVATTLKLRKGALTTSGDAQRYLLKDGIRYGHVLNPRTGWPAVNAPSSVTVAGNSCVEAGIFSTLAILKGVEAESFLVEQGVTHWCQRLRL